MANTPFSQRFKLWLDATRLLVGVGSAVEVEASIAKASAPPVPPSARYAGFLPEGYSGDGRWWIGNLLAKGKDPLIGTAQRFALLAQLWFTGSKELQAFALARFRRQHAEDVPSDTVLAAFDACMSAEKLDPEFVPPVSWKENETTWLGYWACATNDTELFDELCVQRSLASWAGVFLSAPCPWLGWCTLMNRPQWLERALDAGMNIDAPQDLTEGLYLKAKEALGKMVDRVAGFCPPSSKELRKQAKDALAFATMGSGFNALRWAVEANSRACLDLLLYRGINVFEKSKSEQTALDVAIANGQWHAANKLAAHGAPMGFGKEETCTSLVRMAKADFSKVKDPALFSEVCSHLTRISAAENKKFLPSQIGWGQVLLECAGNAKVCPDLVAGLMAFKGSDQWHTWTHTVETGGKKVVRSSLEIALVEGNAVFLKAMAGGGMSLSSQFMKNPMLVTLAWWAPDALEAWLNCTPPKDFSLAWKASLHGLKQGEVTLWEEGWTMARTLLSCKHACKVMTLLARHPNSAAQVAQESKETWAMLAMALRRVESVEAVHEAFGVPVFAAGTKVNAWASVIDRPRNEALVDRLLALGWPVDVSVDDKGTSLLLEAALLPDPALVRKLTAHGADPGFSSGAMPSLQQWLSEQEDHATTQPIRQAVAEGQAVWLEHVAPVVVAPAPAAPRRL